MSSNLLLLDVIISSNSLLRLPPRHCTMTSITWSFMSVCKRSRPRRPSRAQDCAQASLYPVPFSPMLLLSPEEIASSRLIARVRGIVYSV